MTTRMNLPIASDFCTKTSSMFTFSIAALLFQLSGCNSNPYVVRDAVQIKNGISDALAPMSKEIEVVLAEHGSQFNDFSRRYASTYRIGLIYSGPLQNKEHADRLQEIAKAACLAVVDLIDDDKVKANYPKGGGSFRVFIHNSAEAHEGYIRFERERQVFIDRHGAEIASHRLSQKFFPLIEYACGGSRETMRQQIAGEAGMVNVPFLSEGLQAVLQGRPYEPPFDEILPAQVADDYQLPCTTKPWDTRLDGVWRFPEHAGIEGIETLRLSNGGFENVPALGEPRRAENQGVATVLESVDHDVLLMLRPPTGHGNEKTQTFLMEFVDEQFLILNHVNYPYVSGRIFMGAGFLVVRDASGAIGELSPTSAEFFSTVNKFLDQGLTDGRLPCRQERFQKVSGIQDVASLSDAFAISGYWAPKSGEGDADDVAATYRYYFQDGLMYEMTSGPYGLNVLYFSLDPRKSPKEIDVWVTKDGQKDLTLGIYEVSETKLRFCWNEKTRPTGFAANESETRLLTLERMSIPLKASDVEGLR